MHTTIKSIGPNLKTGWEILMHEKNSECSEMLYVNSEPCSPKIYDVGSKWCHKQGFKEEIGSTLVIMRPGSKTAKKKKNFFKQSLITVKFSVLTWFHLSPWSYVFTYFMKMNSQSWYMRSFVNWWKKMKVIYSRTESCKRNGCKSCNPFPSQDL